MSNAVAKKIEAELAAVALELDVLVPPELERLTVLAVRGAEAVLVVVRLVVERLVYSERLSRFWSFTASTPHSWATRNSSLHFSTLPW